MAKKAQKTKKSSSDHDEAARVLLAALTDGRKTKAALANPMVAPLVKKLGPKGMQALSDIAKKQSICPPCPSNA